MDTNILPSFVIKDSRTCQGVTSRRKKFSKKSDYVKWIHDSRSILLWAAYFRGYIPANMFVLLSGLYGSPIGFSASSYSVCVQDRYVGKFQGIVWSKRFHEVPYTIIDEMEIDPFIIEPSDYDPIIEICLGNYCRGHLGSGDTDSDDSVDGDIDHHELMLLSEALEINNSYGKIIKKSLFDIMSPEEVKKAKRNKWSSDQIGKYILAKVPEEFKKPRLSFAIGSIPFATKNIIVDWTKGLPKPIKDVAWIRRRAAINFFASISIRR
jgi:hypothetical protein